MHEILAHLRVGSLVLDLGCAKGSFPQNAAAADVVRVDREPQGNLGALTRFVQADAAQLPFADDTFAAVILNRSLEHFDNLGAALHEIGRVIAPNGSLFVAVPDASSLSDKLHRWLARGGARERVYLCGRHGSSNRARYWPAARSHTSALFITFIFKPPHRSSPITAPIAGAGRWL